jgi:hypothetical protein
MLYVANTRSSGKHVEIRDMDTVNEAIEIAGQFERETFLQNMLTKGIEEDINNVNNINEDIERIKE